MGKVIIFRGYFLEILLTYFVDRITYSSYKGIILIFIIYTINIYS